MPTFLDIGNSFSATSVSEDSFVVQLASKGKRMVVMGDDTWMQMVPWAFEAGAHPYPSFNVMDLDTVDNGVWQVWTSFFSKIHPLVCPLSLKKQEGLVRGTRHSLYLPPVVCCSTCRLTWGRTPLSGTCSLRTSWVSTTRATRTEPEALRWSANCIRSTDGWSRRQVGRRGAGSSFHRPFRDARVMRE
jgi:hypothetical protein